MCLKAWRSSVVSWADVTPESLKTLSGFTSDSLFLGFRWASGHVIARLRYNVAPEASRASPRLQVVLCKVQIRE